jgi:hypothetical protein
MRELVAGQSLTQSSRISDTTDPVTASVLVLPVPDHARRRRSPNATESPRVLVGVKTRRVAPTPLRGAAGLDPACAPAVRAAMGERPDGRAGPTRSTNKATRRGHQTRSLW